MTTYFYHNPNGTTYSEIVDNVAPLWNAYGGFAEVFHPYSPSNTAYYSVGSEKLVVGYINEEHHEPDDGYHSDSVQSMLIDYDGNKFSSYVQLSGGYYCYPDPELIRSYHNIHTLLPYIQPTRLYNAIAGPTLDIVEENTEHVFAFAVPKKMLVLFCGRKVINRFLRTLEREDDESLEGAKPKQLLQFPCNYANHIGVKIMINWMHRACRSEPSDMRPITIPTNLFAAISLSRTLTAFGLHRDASRVDHHISSHHFAHPLRLAGVIPVWKCLPKDSKYTYRMIEELRKQLRGPRCEDKKEILRFLEQNPELKARVDDKEYNNCDDFLPFFGTNWCVEAAIRTQKSLGVMVGDDNDASRAEKAASENLSTSNCGSRNDRATSGAGLNCGNSGSKRKTQKKTRVRHQNTIALKDWKPRSHPTAWPEFDKTVVLKIAQA